MPPITDPILGLRTLAAIALVAVGWWIGGPAWIAAAAIGATWVLLFKDVRAVDADVACDAARPLDLGIPHGPRDPGAVAGIQMEDPLDQESETHDPTLRVLVCEDDSLVRNLVTYILQSRGHTVVSTDDGKRALDIVRGCQPGFDVLLTDMRLPGMTGAELATKVRQDNPVYPVVFMSGFTPLIHRDMIFRAPNTVLLAKPFRPADLQRALMDVWGDRSSSGPGHAPSPDESDLRLDHPATE